MKLAIFGLSISSSWGNGHATLWRGLCRALVKMGDHVTFFEKDTPYYAAHRDMRELSGGEVCIYSDWSEISSKANAVLRDADAGIVTSYCPDALRAAELFRCSSVNLKVFYDLDTPVTLAHLRAGQVIDYIGANGLRDFDLVLSYAGGKALDELRSLLGAGQVAPLYGSVDTSIHRPVPFQEKYRSDFSYLGTYAADREEAFHRMFIEPARRLSDKRFFLAGSLYPEGSLWNQNIRYLQHLSPSDHAAFFCSSRMTLNITRGAMAEMGYCPSGRLFEAAACGVPILSDQWEGLDGFFNPGEEIIVARSTEEVVDAIRMSSTQLEKISKAARERVFREHTAESRANEMKSLLEEAAHLRRLHKKRFSKSGITWGIVPAAGMGSRIQPLAFSKELLPVGSHWDAGHERPRAVSEYLLDRMILGGATHICLIISPGKSDILGYFGDRYSSAHLCYVVQPQAAGLCDALFRAIPFIDHDDRVLVGLPDTVWFPENGFCFLEDLGLSFLTFPVEHPELFDAIVDDSRGNVLQIQVKQQNPNSHWVWGGFKMSGEIFQCLHRFWRERSKEDTPDEYWGSLVNAYIAQGGVVKAVKAGTVYIDVGTLHGYREATGVLARDFSLRQEKAVCEIPQGENFGANMQ